LTALHCATRNGQPNAALALIQRHASLSAKTKNYLTPLHMATQGDHTDCVELLLASGADIDDVSIVCAPLASFTSPLTCMPTIANFINA